MENSKLPNGVSKRMDGNGDVWANDHRIMLGPKYQMQDIDGLIGTLGFAINGENSLFAEYVLDGFENRGKLIRAIGFSAFFDRKARYDITQTEYSQMSLSVYLSLCRLIAQPIKPKFFYVIGCGYPFTMHEIGIDTGEQVGLSTLERDNWQSVWEETGLIKLRRSLESWLRQV